MVEVGGLAVPNWICIGIPLSVILYRYFTPSVEHFKKIGIPHLKPWPFVGNAVSVFAQGLMNFDSGARKHGKIVGMFDGNYPMMMVYDLDLLKQILIKNFQHFQNHKVAGISEYPLRKMMTQIEFDHWKHVRNQLTPTFSGGKLRRMTEAVNMCGRNLVSHLQKRAVNNEVVDVKKEAGNFTMDVIAGTAFGIEIDSSDDGENVFVLNARKMADSVGGLSWRLVLFIVFPRILNILNITVFPKDTMDFFLGIVNQGLKNRGEDEKKAKDFLQLMVNAHVDDPKEADLLSNEDYEKTKEGFIYSKKGLTHEEILAQAFLFFFAGFETTSTQLSFLCYNLACHPETQEKLYREIVEVMADLKEPDYDVIKKMPYLQMCIEETSRLYPSVPRTDRICNEDIEINGMEIKKGTVIGVPIWCIHHDPEIYPEPYKFIPERFSAEEKAERHPMAWLPFGQGPRNCVGMRLALMEIKFAVIHVLLKFKMITCSETEMPEKLKLEKLRMAAVNGLKIKLESRN